MKKKVLRACDFQQKNENKLAKVKSSSALPVILLLIITASMIAFFIVTIGVIAKPVGKNPGTSWPAGTIWGTNLRLENDLYAGLAWFGTRATELKVGAPPDPPDGLVCEFFDGARWAIWVKVPAANENWPVRLRAVGEAPSSGTLSSTMENADTLFVPQDYSVVLENTALSLRVNLRKENKFFESLPVRATLYVDNAVNIQSIDNLDPLTGIAGDNLRLRVFVKNTGRYTDNYTVNAGGSLDPTILNLAPGSTDNVIVTTTLPTGTENVVITAEGNYATDQDYITATGVTLIRGVSVSITPSSQENDSGGTLTYTVTVNSLSNVLENFQLTRGDNAGWTLSLDNSWLLVPQGENRITKLTVTIPPSAIGGTLDNIWVKAASQDNAAVFDNKSCLAKAKILRGVQVVITPPSQENDNGGNLKYDVLVKNLGNVQENFQLTRGDNAGWTLSLDNRWLLVPQGENRITKLTVTIPASAIGGTLDNVWARAASQDNTSVFDNKSCLAHVRLAAVASIDVVKTATPLVSKAGDNVVYNIKVTNTGDITLVNITVMDSLLGNLSGSFADNLAPLASENHNFNYTVKVSDPNPLVNTVIVHANPMGMINDITDNAQASVTLEQPLAEVEVTILPDPLNPDNIAHVTGVTTFTEPCWSYDPLTYAVKVSNKGVLDDDYELTVTGPSTWGLMLTPDSLFVQAGDNEYASLSITLPNDWTGGLSGVVTVTAVGMLSSENQNNLYPTDNDSVTVTSGIENNVAKEIFPGTFEPQTGAPGSPLVWLVVLKNTGNIVENLSLSLSEVLTGVSPESVPRIAWGATFDNTLFENVAPCTDVFTYLRVTIPGDAKTSEWDNIIITASDGLGALDIEWVRANVAGPVTHPSIDVVKTATPLVSKAGDNVVYNIKVTNTGDITLVNITVMDSLLGNLSGSFADNLAPLASENHDFTYTVQVSDPNTLVNTVTVHANPMGMVNDITDNAQASVTLVHPSIDVVKTATPLVSKAGDNVVYNIKVTNTGDITLVNITVMDSLLGNLSGSFAGTLAPLASENHDFNYTVQVSDPNTLVNTVVVHANPTGMINDITDNAQASVTLVNENENEPLWVNKGPSTTTTQLSASMILPGESVTDTVTVTGLPHPPYPLPTGSVIFQVKFNGGAWVTYDNENLVNGTSTSIQLTLFATGQYWFRAIYSGDNNYENSQSPDDNEPLTVFKHDTTTATLLSSSTITLGENVTDKVTVTGSFGTPTGTVIFQVKFNGGSWVTYDNESLVNGAATSIEYVPLAAGQYWFRAIYSGDDNYNGSQSLDDNEPLIVNKHNTTTRTQLSASVITLGENVTDNAYVTTGLPHPPYPLPTGTITFQVKFNGGAWVTFDIENLVNGMATSIPYVPLQAGQYYFRAIYSGDNNYNGSQSS